MKKLVLLLSIFFISYAQINAQDNVAEIAHAFIKAIKTNDLSAIKGRYINANAAYAILPKESAGMNVRQKNDTYIKPMYARFSENFEKIQTQIKTNNINVRKIDLISYKMSKKKQGELNSTRAMSLFFNYNKKEHILPISVVEIDERWYILEILNASDLFK